MFSNKGESLDVNVALQFHVSDIKTATAIIKAIKATVADLGLESSIEEDQQNMRFVRGSKAPKAKSVPATGQTATQGGKTPF